jgi:L-seryl-tRNA(Ser) seleniumtransferase
MSGNLLGRLPSVKDLLASQPLKYVAEQLSQNAVVDGIRSFFDHLRTRVQAAAEDLEVPGPDDLARQIARWILSEDPARLRPAINATGILLPSQPGRAPLAKEAVDEIRQATESYSSADLDPPGDDLASCATVVPLLVQLTGAESAFVVNSHSAAAMLALAALAAGREVIVSRGELVEIGGDYRLPQIFAMSGAAPREVGSTNATRVADYGAAVQDRSAAILRVDPASFAVVGATERPALAELVSLAREKGLPLIDDIGFGSVVDVRPLGLTGFPSASASIAAGADLVILSGDALLGGPQCGIVVGRRSLIENLARHPLAAPLRASKLTLAALAATLRIARDPADAKRLIPLLTLITTSIENLRNRAERLAPQIAAAPAIASAEAMVGESHLGPVAIASQILATYSIAVTPRELSAEELDRRLRTGQISVVGRVDNGRVILDLRTIFPRQDVDLVNAFEQIG